MTQAIDLLGCTINILIINKMTMGFLLRYKSMSYALHAPLVALSEN